MYVIDAPVAVKWFIDEEYSGIARKILQGHLDGDYLLVCPDLIVTEVANALRFSGIFSSDELIACIENFYDLNLDLVAPLPIVIFPAIRIAEERNITIYDALYIALSGELAYPLTLSHGVKVTW